MSAVPHDDTMQEGFMRGKTLLVLPLALGAVAACQRTEKAADSAAVAQQAAAVVSTAGGGLAERREPQAYLDSARQWLGSRDTAVLLRMLGAAAPMLREHADLPTSAAKNELRASAAELEGMIARIRAGQPLTNDEYLPALVRLNLGEAEHHRSQAAVAWASHDTTATGEELIMAADHFDRALRDAHGQPSGLMATLVAEAQKLGTAMNRGDSFAVPEVNSKLAALGKAIRAERGVPVSKDAGT